MATGDGAAAAGRIVVRLPPSRATVILLAAFVLWIPAYFYPPLGLFSFLLLVAGMFVAWLRLTGAGQVVLAAPGVAWAIALVTRLAAGASVVPQILVAIAVLLSVLALFLLVQPMAGLGGMQRAKLDTRYVRRVELGDRARVAIRGDSVCLAIDGKEPATYALRELRPAVVEDRPEHSDLALVDIYGDEVVHLRGFLPRERAAMRAFAEALKERTV